MSITTSRPTINLHTGDKWCYPLPIARLDSDLIANVNEDVLVTHRYECKLAEVRVRWEVLQRVQLVTKLSFT